MSDDGHRIVFRAEGASGFHVGAGGGVAAGQEGVSRPRGMRGVDLAVEHGEFLAILGTSGSGKTTLLKMVNRLIEPRRARCSSREATTEWDPIVLRRSIGYVIQEAGDAAPDGPRQRRPGASARGERAERDASARGAAGAGRARSRPVRRRLPNQLSGGQRQRVGVARALAADPDLILMDEPFGALDPITRRELQDEFRGLQQRLGKTVIFVTHDIREACRIADRLALMDHGALVQLGPAADFRERPGERIRPLLLPRC